MTQDTSKTEVIVGSNDKSLKLFGSGDRPSYSKNGEGNTNIALASDIYNPTITIKQAGAEKGSFTLNQSDAKTIELIDTTYTPGTGLGLSTDNQFYVKTNYGTNGTNYKVTTDDSGNLYVAVPWTSVATTSSNGLMSSTDKSKLDGIADNANNYSLPVATSEALGGIKVGYSSNGKKYAVELDSDKAYVNVPWTDTVIKVEDSLNSSSTTAALSAKQGKELQSQIETKAYKSYVDNNYLSTSAASTQYIQKGSGVPLTSIVFGYFTNFIEVSTTLSADSSGIYYYKFVGSGSLQIFDGESNTDNTTIFSSMADGINEGFFGLSLKAETIGYSCKITLFSPNGITTLTGAVGHTFKFKRTKDAVELYRVR